jgi:hypothetical protein
VHARKQQFKKVHMYKMQSERLEDLKSSENLERFERQKHQDIASCAENRVLCSPPDQEKKRKASSLIFCVAGSSSTGHLEKASV